MTRGNKMNTLRKFVEQYRVANTEIPNIGSLRGLWKIPESESKRFLQLYCRAAHEFTPTDHCAFVFRPPRLNKQPFLLDLDFQTKKEIPLTIDLYKQFARIVAQKLQAALRLYY